MPEITEADAAGMTRGQVREHRDALLDKVASIREKNSGTLVGLTGTDADEVREAMAVLNTVVGPRMEALTAQEKDESDYSDMTAKIETPVTTHPGRQAGAAAARGRGADATPRDIGGLFIESAAWRAFKDDNEKDKVVTVPIAALWSGYQGIGEVPSQGVLDMQSALFQSTDYPIQPQFLAQPVETLYQANNIGPLFAQGSTQANAVRYVTETVTATGAAEVAEAGTKPEGQLAFAAVDEPIRKIAVLLPLTDETFDDADLLRAYLNARLRLFVQMREDLQLLSGNGTAPNLKGILLRSGINTATSYSIGGANPDQALLDAIFHAAMRVRDAYLEPDAFVIKPSTWELARLAKDGNRNYLLGPANDDQPARVWGLRGVLNANMPAQTATNKVVLVGAFAASAMLIRKSGIDLAISDSHSTFFAENKHMLRAEERVGLAVFRPAGFATVTSAA